MYEELAMYIDGEWCQGSDGAGEDGSDAGVVADRSEAERGFGLWW